MINTMVRQIGKALIIYVALYVLEVFVFSTLLYPYRMKNIAFSLFLLQQFCNNQNYEITEWSATISIAKSIFELILTTVLSSYVFSYILNREPHIIFPDKLVIRHRSSTDAHDSLTLGVLFGNKERFIIHDATCSIVFTYKKAASLKSNVSDVTLHEERRILEKYYRFSFPLESFPEEVLARLASNSWSKSDAITVILSGNANCLGNTFWLHKRYGFENIVYDESIPNFYENRVLNIPFVHKKIPLKINGRNLRKYHWKEMFKTYETQENKERSKQEIMILLEQRKERNCYV
ncbi:hypothetical protein [uncultured Gemmiger sp.]|uniref:hypothetical protein n=1 Tax=uncultured Gemmiger sp. TaxID=1623490 RepID=UPI0025F691E7|nr:hypothetical protein [uncultured Gemmiger sp.]